MERTLETFSLRFSSPRSGETLILDGPVLGGQVKGTCLVRPIEIR